VSNQFSAELVYHRTESVAFHARTGAVCVVRDRALPILIRFDDEDPPDPSRPVLWRIHHHGSTQEGWSRDEGGARRAIKRRVAKLPDRQE
jgi:hypothetical protein